MAVLDLRFGFHANMSSLQYFLRATMYEAMVFHSLPFGLL